MGAMTLNFVALLATLMMGASCIAWAERRASLRRLRHVMGRTDGTLAAHVAHRLQWFEQHIPGANDAKLRLTVLQAGYFQRGAAAIFAVSRLLVVVILAVFLFLRSGPPTVNAILLDLFLIFFTYRLFLIGLKLKAEARQQRIRRELPATIDILLMVLNSGVSIDQCLRYSTSFLEQTAPRCSQVLQRYVADVDNGMSYEAAFDRMGQRFGIMEGYDLVGLIRQGLLQGGEITAVLERFGAEIAENRVFQAREQIGRKSIMLTAVMLAFFMPVLLIILAGPAVYKIKTTLHTVQHQLHKKGAHK